MLILKKSSNHLNLRTPISRLIVESTPILRKIEDVNNKYALLEASIGDSTEKMVLKAGRNIGK